MNTFKTLTISLLLLFSGSFLSHAQGYETWVMDHWNKDKVEALKEAKAQDKFVFLFVGRPTCPTCKLMSTLLSDPENPFVEIIDNHYITLYSWYDDEDDRAEVYEYIEKFYKEREEEGLVRQLPWLYIINPDKEGESVASMYRPYPDWQPDEETMRKFLAVDLLESNDLDWYADEDKVFESAQKQNKFILRFQGNGTSPNSQKVMKLLVEKPLKQILEKNYILWYVDDDDCGCDITLYAAAESKDEENKPLPYISIFNPNHPSDMLEELWGVQEVETLEEIFLKYSVSNEKIFRDNNVSISGNVLHIANQTNNELIHIYSLTGQSVAAVRKNDFTVSINASDFPKGVLIIHSSAGWSVKILNQ
jgi:thioredoxin-related protein